MTNNKKVYVIVGERVYKFTGNMELKPVLNIRKFIVGITLIAISLVGIFKLTTAWINWQREYEKSAFEAWQTVSSELRK